MMLLGFGSNFIARERVYITFAIDLEDGVSACSAA